MELPFIFLDVVWHIGAPLDRGVTFKPRPVKSWDFEFGLLSVSLDPEAWRDGWAGASGLIYEFAAVDRPLCFLDADETLLCARSDIEAAALSHGLIRQGPEGVEPTDRLYAGLRLTPGSQLHLASRSFEDQSLQAALAVLASGDSNIDGLWWTDRLQGDMRTERGGIFQHLLTRLAIDVVSRPAARTSPSATWLPCNIL